MSDTKKTILVTGGAGALGSYICKRYLDEGHRVICIDNLMKTRSTENIEAFLDNKNFKFIKHDIIDPIEFKNEKIDWIFNAACPVSCISLQVDPIHTVQSCTTGVINMLELARKHDAKILQCSSADIYGEMLDHPFIETDFGSTNTLSARGCYEEGKRIAETLFMDYHRKYGVEIKIVRIFNTAGPHTQMTDGRVPSIFIYNALAGRDIRLVFGGKTTRSFLHVEDQVEGMDRMMKTDKEITGPINIGNDSDEVTMQYVAEQAIEKTNSTSKIVYDKLDDAPKYRRPNVTLARTLLDWKPTRSLDELLDDMIASYKRKGLPESRVLVFATTYYPDGGPAEAALLEMAEAMPNTEFHVVTSKFRKGLSAVENFNNITVYRVGFGMKLDKYLLPFLGAKKALALNKKNKYRFMWSLMASYGGITGLVLKMLGSKASFIVARDTTEQYEGSKLKQWIANKVETLSDAEFSDDDRKAKDTFIGKLQDTYAELIAKQEGKLTKPV